MGIALIAGASGLTGGEVLKSLLEDSRCTSVISLTRKPGNTKHPKLTEVITDFGDVDGINLPSLVDDCFLCIGSTIAKAGSQEKFEQIDRHINISIARLAKKAGASRCALISAAGANASSSIFYNKIKGITEDDLIAIGFDKTYIFRPGLLLGDRKEKRTAEKISQVLMGTWTQHFFGKYASIKVEQLGKAMVNVVYDANSSSGIYHFPDMKKYF